jgi:hypothetical protein
MQARPMQAALGRRGPELWRATCWLFNQKAESCLMSAKWASVFNQRRAGEHAKGRDGQEEGRMKGLLLRF